MDKARWLYIGGIAFSVVGVIYFLGQILKPFPEDFAAQPPVLLHPDVTEREKPTSDDCSSKQWTDSDGIYHNKECQSFTDEHLGFVCLCHTRPPQ